MEFQGGVQTQIGRIRALLLDGKFRQAAGVCQQVVLAYPNEPDLYLQFGIALHGIGQMQQAAESFTRAMQIRPGFTEAGLQLGALLLQTGCAEQAAATYKPLLEQMPNNVPALVGLGSAHMQLGDPQAAWRSCERALAISPGNIAANALAAEIDEKQGAPEQARARLKPLIMAGVSHTGVVLAFAAACRSLKQPEVAIAGLEALLAGGRPMSPTERAGIHFALGSMNDAAGRYDDAFASYSEGNRINYRGFNRRQPEQDVSAMIWLYTQEWIQQMPCANNTSQLPVFVVGMHRSGTTLVEQILSSHPAVHGAGELPDITRMMFGLDAVTGTDCRYIECLPQLSEQDLDLLCAGHLQKLAAMDSNAQRVIDKMPGNFMYLGFLQQVFPGTRVIHCTRNPLDTCLSGYFQNFGGAQTYMNDLGDLGFVYRCYHRMMTHWNKVLQLPILEVRYEELVARPDEVIRGLVDFCGLEWDAQCLDFHSTGRYVNTASYDQVRQPMYSRSVNRWKNYASHLQPLREVLGNMAGW